MDLINLIKTVPIEIRLKIWRHAIEVYDDSNHERQPILQVLKHFNDKEMYDEALMEYNNSHRHQITELQVQEEALRVFKMTPMKELLKIRHLKLIIDEQDIPKEYGSFRGHKIKLKNNIETLMFDYTRTSSPESVEIPWGWISAIEILKIGSTTGLKRIILRLPRSLEMRGRSQINAYFDGSINCEYSTRQEAQVDNLVYIWDLRETTY